MTGLEEKTVQKEGKGASLKQKRKWPYVAAAVLLVFIAAGLLLAKNAERAMVIGGGSIYCQMLPYCDRAIITKVHVTPESDTFFPNLDEDPAWELTEILLSGEESGIAYEMCVYTRKGTA